MDEKTMDKSFAAAQNWMKKHEKALFWPLFAILTALLIFFCFYKLDGYMLNPWDESTHGTNAYEMTQTGDWIVTTIQYKTDYFNTKPPLSMWLIALSYKVFGYNAFALRFYSAVSMVAIGVLMALWLKKRLGPLAGLASLGFLLACEPLYNYHMARHGDADAFYNLLFVVAMLAMLELERHPKCIYLCGLMFALAFLTKSWHAMAIAVIGFVYLVLTGLIRQYKMPQIAGFAACALVPELLWAAARYMQDGWQFLATMITSDIGDRLAGKAVSVADSKIWDYITDYSRYPEFLGYLLLAAAAAFCVFAQSRNGKHKSNFAALGIALYALVPFVMFSLASAKKIWYVFPAVLGLVLAAACGVQLLADSAKSVRSAVIPVAVILLSAVPILAGCKESLKVVLRAENGNAQQLFMQEKLERSATFSKQKLYQKDGEVPDWREPSDQLSAELYGDMIPTPGGIAGFAADPGSYLILDEETWNETPELAVYEVYAADRGYLLLHNSQAK